MKLSEVKEFQSHPEFNWLLVVILVGLSSFLVGKNLQPQIIEIEVAPTPEISLKTDSGTVVNQIVEQIESTTGEDGTNELTSSLININRASADELDTLPGIGPVYATRIIEYRNENGSFTSIEDLQNVKGIGPKTLEKIRPLVTM